LYNPALAIRFSTATLALLTNETYHSMIKHRAESHGIDPEHHLQELKDSVFMMRGYASVDTGNYSNALKDLLRIEHINRQDFLHYHKALGAAAYNVGNWALAVKSLTNIITGPDDNAYYRAMLGESCLFLEHYEKAESNLLRALSYDTNTVRPYILLANLYSRCPDHTLRDGDGALEFINRALLMAPSEPERLYETKACALAEAGRFDESVAYLEKAMAFAKSTPGLTGTLTFLEKELHAFNNKQTFIKGMDSQADTNRAFKPAQ
jgi:tetratricopeptide (TPR) repeat protein